jgi:2-polyprenyl-3-methyl-5-hydroxy-6-metoxy-1,4-benzoquinol methylase
MEKIRAVDKKYLLYTDYVKEPGGIKRLNFFVSCIKEHQFLHQLRPQDIEILDIGCGNGNITIPVASLGYNIIGVDCDRNSIENAKRKNIFINARFINCSIDELNRSKKYDIVIASEVIEHLDNPLEVLKLIKCILKSDGLFLVSIPNGYCLEELIRRFTSHSNLGRMIKYLIRRHLMKKENTQSLADSPHLHFFSLFSFKRLLDSLDFKVITVKNGAIIFKGLFYMILRLFMQRESKIFRWLNYSDGVLSEIVPVFFGDSWLLRIQLSERATE